MSFFWKKANGSITVFLVLILIPSIFFVGFLDDIARVKMYNNQAVMAADNYGQAILSEYDNLLKELYGLFAVTQNEEGLNALNDFETYMKSSFNPSEGSINYDYDSLNLIFGEKDYSGFMPYSNAEVSLSYTTEGLNSALSNTDIFATQVGDFMRFRVVQMFLNQAGDFTDGNLGEIIDQVCSSGANDEVAAAKEACSKPVENFIKAVQEYYNVLNVVVAYSDYVTNAHYAYVGIADNSSSRSINGAIREMQDITESQDYKDYIYIYFTNTSDIEAIDAEVQAEIDSISENKPDKDETSVYYLLEPDDRRRMSEYWDDNLESDLNDDFESVVKAYALACKIDYDSGEYKNLTYDKNNINVSCISVVTLESVLDDLGDKAEAVNSTLEELNEKLEALQTAIDDPEVSSEVRATDQAYIDRIGELQESAAKFSEIVSTMESHSVRSANSNYEDGMMACFEGLKENWSLYMNNESVSSWPARLDVTEETKTNTVTNANVSRTSAHVISREYWDFRNQYNQVWVDLDYIFGSNNNNDLKKKADSKTSQANTATENAKREFSGDEETNARNMPSGIYTEHSSLEYLFSDLGKTVNNVKHGSWGNEGNRRLLHLYTIEYDFGMFSSRVTNVNPEGSENQDRAMSLTGYEMAKNINYLYGAELEYLIGGSNTSKNNLNTTRNAIVAFRMLLNFTSTYTISEVNEPIRAISEACNAIPYVGPAVAIVVDLALRTAVATIETSLDWKALKNGEKVVLYKNQVDDLKCIDDLGDLLSNDIDGRSSASSSIDYSGGNSSGRLELDYENYLLIMMIFFVSPDAIFERTQNLVEINVNTVAQSIGSNGTISALTFKMSDAYTAVKTTCTINSGFVFMPDGFARTVLGASSDTYNSLNSFEDNVYSYSVIRSY